ncbi:MAG: SDR family oxidoreductase [Candidatus Latescibacterota bacterium]|nr:SDR family oxidoreductase [Candidatus Latescibacterota bacterium]
MSSANDRFRLDGQVAVVIGATGVLGGAIASGLAEAGAAVAVLGRNERRGEARAQAILKAGGQAVFVICDATDRDALELAREQIRDGLGEPAVLVNAAGGNDPAVTVSEELAVEEITAADWRRNFDLNLVGGVFLPCQAFGPTMRAAGSGSIINIASITAHVPLSKVVAYSAAKAGVVSLTRFLAREWAPQVRVNSITPGFFPGEQNRRLLFNADGTPSERGEQILSHTPMARFGEPEELVGAAVFLASPAASLFITGEDLRVDGGFLATTI